MQDQSFSCLFAGVDVSLNTLALAWPEDGAYRTREFKRDRRGVRSMRKLLLSLGRPVRLCLEPTSTYHIIVLDELSGHEGLSLHLPNPMAVRSFGKVKMHRGKTDKQDCILLAEYCRDTDPPAWNAPPAKARELCSIMRRVDDLRQRHAALLCMHASAVHGAASSIVLKDMVSELRNNEKRMKQLRGAAMKVVRSDEELSRQFDLIDSIPGFAEKASLDIISELAMLPPELSKKQWLAAAGLDPEACESGKMVKPRRISRKGNKRMRKALMMPAIAATKHCPAITQFYQRLLARGLCKMSALCAVMRKLLQAIWGVINTDTTFNPMLFSPKSV